MAYGNNSRTWTANGNINPAVFVKFDPSLAWYVLQAGVGDFPIGISQPGQQFVPFSVPGGSIPQYAATQGYPLLVFQELDYCMLTIGTGGALADTWVKPDANGAGVATLAGEPGFAFVYTAASAGDLAYVRFQRANNNPGASAVLTTAVSLTATAYQAKVGYTILVTATGQTITLPVANTVPNGTLKIINTVASSNTAVLPGNGTDSVVFTNLTIAAGHGIINTTATAKAGDAVDLISDGVSKWYAYNSEGTWAAD